MGIKKSKPTTAGKRDSAVDDFADITTHEPYKPLLAPHTKKGGRNNKGRITVRHRGGGHKRRYRMLDFIRSKEGKATVETIAVKRLKQLLDECMVELEMVKAKNTIKTVI